MTVTINGKDEALASKGLDLGVTEWTEVTQEQVNQFADATGDHQWIHVDPERAKAESPYGGPIAHGFLTLSLVSQFLPQLVEVTGMKMGVNYGCNKVRFPAPVPVGANLRARASIGEVEEVGGGGVQVTWNVALEVEGSEKPSCVAEFLARYYF